MAGSGEHFLDPAVLARIDNYNLIARTVVEGFIAGLHRSLFHGFGSEFVQYRNYSRGDDLKYIDWKVFARLDKYQMKVFQEETNANCYIVLDSSASMAYQGQRSALSKLHYGKIMAACFAYLINKQSDNVGLFAYGDDLRVAVPPSHKSGQVHYINVELARLQAEGQANHARVLNYLGEHFHRRGLVIMISDFLDESEDMRKALKRFRAAQHEVVLVQLFDDDELDFDFAGTARFVDSESAAEMVTSPTVVRERYVAAIQAYIDSFHRFCVKSDIDVTLLRTSEPLAPALASYLHRREALGI